MIGREGAGAAQVAAHRTRDKKEIQSQEVVLQRHRELAAKYGNQADRVVAQARGYARQPEQQPERAVQQSATYARDRIFERSAVQDERAILQSMLDRGMGQLTHRQVREEFARRVTSGEFRALGQREGRAARQYTTAEMVRMERQVIDVMQRGNERRSQNPMLVDPYLRIRIEDQHPELSKAQLGAVDEIFLSREKMVGLDGVAGAGKTTTLAVIREGAEAQGYRVEGFAPTSRAAQKLSGAGMSTSTLQHYLVRGEQPDTGEKRLFVLDESSLASTRQMHEFVSRLHRNDRVLLVGDTRQHEAVEAGRPFAQLQEAGMHTVNLDEILRQRDPELKQAVEQLARGEVREAVASLDDQGRIHEYASRAERITAIAKEYTRVVGIDAQSNLLAVVRADRSEQTYDPRRQMGVTVYREQERAFSVGDRIQFTAPANDLKIANRELATVEAFAANGTMRLKLDDGRSVAIAPERHLHLDHGYAVTSYSSQGQTAERVLVHVDTELGAKDLLNSRMAYVAISRGQNDAQIFTNDREKLSQALSRDVSHQSAYKPEQAIASLSQKIGPSSERGLDQGMGYGLGL